MSAPEIRESAHCARRAGSAERKPKPERPARVIDWGRTHIAAELRAAIKEAAA